MKKEKLPIFIISGKSPLSAAGGGYSTYSYNLAKILKKLGHDVFILALSDETSVEKTKVGTLVSCKITLPILNVKIYALPGLPFYSIVFGKKIKEMADEERFKKFIVWGIGPWGLAATILKLLLGKKVFHINNYFTTVRHEWWGGVRALRISDYGLWPKIKYLFIYSTVVQYLAQLEKLIFKSADKIITNYKSTEEILKKEFGVSPKKFYRAHFYVKVYERKVKEAATPDKIKLPKKYILFFSRQDPRKGVNFLLRAMARLLKRGYKIPLLIAGGGDMLQANKKLAEKLGVEKLVKFLGFVNDPKPLMKSCSVFVFPSIEEGAGALTINEAMEMSLPIVSTACDGIVEDLENEKSALLVAKENSSQLANAITKLLDNPPLARQLARNARLAYAKRFTLEKMKFDIKRLLDTV